MNSGTTYPLVNIIALVSTIFAAAYSISAGATENIDGMIEVELTSIERQHVQTEMRTFLASIQQIIKGTSENEMAQVATHARMSGKAAQAGVPSSLKAKLPQAFKKLGADTHARFDLLALDAESIGDGEHALAQLAELMENCVACHASYRVTLVK